MHHRLDADAARTPRSACKALALGAADYVTKPGSAALTTADDFKRELLAKVKALGAGAPRAVARRAPCRRPRRAGARETGVRRRTVARAPATIRLRPLPADAVPDVRGDRLLDRRAAGAVPRARARSSGGRAADPDHPAHAGDLHDDPRRAHRARRPALAAAEAVDGEPVVAGRVYIAPGDFHMVVEGTAPASDASGCTKGPPENFCRPSVDPMLRSLAAGLWPRVLCVDPDRHGP